MPATFADLVEALAARKPHVSQQLHDFVGLVRCEPPELVVRLLKPLSGDFIKAVADALREVTGTRWQVSASDQACEPSLLEQEKAGVERLRQEILEAPLVQAAFEAFPEAELVGYSIEEQRSA